MRLIVITTLLFFAIVFPSSATELATGKPTSASSVYSSAYPASAATDGSSSTRWSSVYANNQWIKVDLGATYSVTSVEVNWEAAYGKTYRVQVSTDGTNFTTVASVTRSSAGLATTSFGAVDARFVRLLLDTRGTVYGFSIWEWRVYGTAPPAGTEGDTRPFANLDSGWDSFVNAALSGNATNQNYLRHFERALVYQNRPSTPWYPADNAYDQNVPWFPRGFTYRDSMVATYVGRPLIANEHYLFDVNGNRLYINYKCSGGACTQYAADLGNPATRQRYVDSLAVHAAESGGIMMDDLNFNIDIISNSAGQPVTPVDPRTGQLMTAAAWRGYVLQLVRDVKAAYPTQEVVGNTVYYKDGGMLSKQEIKDAFALLDGWYFERGFGDTGVVAGNGTFGFDTIKAVIDYVHGQGGFVVHDIQSTALSNTYTQAAYLCTNGGTDYYKRPEMKTAWNSTWDLNLGSATTACVKGTDGIYRRSFTNGSVTVNPANKTGTIG